MVMGAWAWEGLWECEVMGRLGGYGEGTGVYGSKVIRPGRS